MSFSFFGNSIKIFSLTTALLLSFPVGAMDQGPSLAQKILKEMEKKGTLTPKERKIYQRAIRKRIEEKKTVLAGMGSSYRREAGRPDGKIVLENLFDSNGPIAAALNDPDVLKDPSQILFLFDFDGTIVRDEKGKKDNRGKFRGFLYDKENIFNEKNIFNFMTYLNKRKIPWAILTIRGATDHVCTEQDKKDYQGDIDEALKKALGHEDLSKVYSEAFKAVGLKFDEDVAKGTKNFDLKNFDFFHDYPFCASGNIIWVGQPTDNKDSENKNERSKFSGIDYVLRGLKKKPKYVVFIDNGKHHIEAVYQSATEGKIKNEDGSLLTKDAMTKELPLSLKKYSDQEDVKFILIHYPTVADWIYQTFGDFIPLPTQEELQAAEKEIKAQEEQESEARVQELKTYVDEQGDISYTLHRSQTLCGKGQVGKETIKTQWDENNLCESAIDSLSRSLGGMAITPIPKNLDLDHPKAQARDFKTAQVPNYQIQDNGQPCFEITFYDEGQTVSIKDLESSQTIVFPNDRELPEKVLYFLREKPQCINNLALFLKEHPAKEVEVKVDTSEDAYNALTSADSQVQEKLASDQALLLTALKNLAENKILDFWLNVSEKILNNDFANLLKEGNLQSKFFDPIVVKDKNKLFLNMSEKDNQNKIFENAKKVSGDYKTIRFRAMPQEIKK